MDRVAGVGGDEMGGAGKNDNSHSVVQYIHRGRIPFSPPL
jgi:hypothetical protein